jgi:hypothetical protein
MLIALAVAGALTALVAGLTGAWSPCGFSMVDTIGTALGDVRPRVRRLACLTFLLGCLLGGAITFLGLAELGRLIAKGDLGARELAGAALALAAAVADWRGIRIAPQIRRQVPESWRWRMALPVACALYGVLLGLGFTTFVLAFATWALAGVSFASASPFTGLAIGLGFGLGRALPVLWIAPRLANGREDGNRLLDGMAREPRLWLGLRRVDALGLGLCALFMSGTATASAAVLRHARGRSASGGSLVASESRIPPSSRIVAASATDPSASEGAFAWQQLGGVGMLSAGSGEARALPGSFPALGESTIAWYGGGAITVASLPSLAVKATFAVPAVSAVAVSESWLVYRSVELDGEESLLASPLYAPEQSRHLAGPLPAGELGRPSLDGSAAVFTIDTALGSEIELFHLASGRSRIVRSSTDNEELLNPSLLDGRLAFLWVDRCVQQLRMGSATTTKGDRVMLSVPSNVARDRGYEQSYEHAYNTASTCPNRRTGPGGRLRLGTTAMSDSLVYVTELYEDPPGARIISLPR